MALRWRLSMRVLILVLGILSLVSFSIECSCMAPRTPVVIVMRGLVFHPLCWMASINGSYWYVYVWWLILGICHDIM